jgi:3-hydroxyacyl-[acyl-carrier-protein] dehydratase
MPPQFLYDISSIDLDRVAYSIEKIREINPQRGDMEHLNAIIYAEPELGRIIAYKDVREDEFWVPGHIPGRPLLPGVIMIEAAAQMASFYTKMFCGWKGFIGFGAVDGVKFRGQVTPPSRFYLIGQKIWERHHRLNCKIQGMVDGNLVFESEITGVEF